MSEVQTLPDVNENSIIARELVCFRQAWSPKNPAMGEIKAQQITLELDRILRGIDEVKRMGYSLEVADAIRDARFEIQLALTHITQRSAKEWLQLFLDEYPESESEV